MRLVLLTLVFGCYASHELPVDGEHDPAFADDWWVVAAHGWALIPTETVYRFHDDGEVEVIRHSEGTYFEGEAGQWWDYSETTEDAPVCEFGDRWWSEAGRLHIESECSDDATRVLVLEEIVGGNALGDDVYVVEPRGALGFWVRDALPGGFRRCADDC